MRSVRSAGQVRLPFGSAPRVRCVCLRSCSRSVCAPPPFRVGVARALRAVPVQGAGRAVPGGSCPSAFPAAVPCDPYLAFGGVARSLRPLAVLGVARPPAGRPALMCWPCALWGRHEGASGGRLLFGCGASWARRCPDRPSFGTCSRRLPPTGCGCGSAAVGTRHQPHCARSCELALCALGAAQGCPGGGSTCLGVQRLGSGAPPRPTARPLGRAAGAHYPLAVGAGGVGVGTRHEPHSTRPCELALPAVGAAQGRPGGGPPACVWSVRGRALSRHRPPVLWGVRPGPTTHWLWVRVVRAWGPVTNTTTRALATWLCAL